jgi:hypothetical protein
MRESVLPRAARTGGSVSCSSAVSFRPGGTRRTAIAGECLRRQDLLSASARWSIRIAATIIGYLHDRLSQREPLGIVGKVVTKRCPHLGNAVSPPVLSLYVGMVSLAGTFARAGNIERHDDAVRSAHDVVTQAGRVGVESRLQLMGKPDE